ncbi:MAG: hypothetical protein AB7E42_09020 [Anaerotignaceae bacterium]
MKEIKKILEPLKRKMDIEKFLCYFLRAQTVALAVIFVILLVSKFVYIKNVEIICTAMAVIGFIVSLILICIKRTTVSEAAKVADRLCLKERLSTALEIAQLEAQSTMESLVINDAIEKSRQAQPEKSYKFAIPKNTLKVMAVVIIALFATGFVKSPDRVDVGDILNSNIKEIEQVKKEVNTEKIIDDEDIKELNKQVNVLTKSLKQASSKKEAVQTMDEAQQELKNLEKTGVSKDLEKISESLSANEAGKKLSDSIKNGDTQAMNASLDELNSQIEEMSEEELQALLEAMKEAIENVDKEELKAALSNYAGQIAAGNFNPSANSLQQLKDTLETATNASQNLKAKVADLNKLIAQATQTVQNSGSESTSTQQVEGQSGSQAGSGQGEGSGQGSGSGQGGNGRGDGHVETEEVYTREESNKAGYDTKVDGAENSGGDTEISNQQTTGTAGESVPYDQVVGEYKEEELKSIDESSVPYGMKELVADYFSALEK